MNLSELISSPLKGFFDRRIDPSDVAPSDTEEKTIATTFRLPADIRNYYQLMADASRITLQGAVLQVLSSVMESHTIYQRADVYAKELSHRFFLIFDMAGIPIRKIPQFLKGFNIRPEDLASNSRVAELMSDKLESFLADTFRLNEKWISTGKGSSHKENNYNKSTGNIQGLINDPEHKLSLKVLFDNRILTNTTILDKDERREVYCALIEELSLNDTCYKRMYLLKPIIWDDKKSNASFVSIIENMKARESTEGGIEFYAYSDDDVDTNNFGISILTDFYSFGKTGVITAELPSANIQVSKSEFIELRKTLQLNL